MPLMKKEFYQVANGSGGLNFIINICGNVNGSGCNQLGANQQAGSCIFHGKEKSNTVIGKLSKKLEYSEGQLTLKYE